MAKRLILLAVVASFLIAGVALADSWFDLYYSFGLGTTTGALPAGYGNWDTCQYNTNDGGLGNVPTSSIFVTDNPLDDTCAATFGITNPNVTNIPVAGFSYDHIDYSVTGPADASNDPSNMSLNTWLASKYQTLLFSTSQCIGPYSASGGCYDANDDVLALYNGVAHSPNGNQQVSTQYATEQLIAHTEPLTQAPPYTPESLGTPIPGGNTFGVTDIFYSGSSINGDTREYIALADFDVTQYAPDPNQRIYYTASNWVQGQFVGATMHRPNVVFHMTTGPAAGQYRGSGYGDTALAGDVLTADNLNYIPSYGIFEYAWKIAGTMLGDKFWNTTTVIGTKTYSLVWNNYYGYVSTSTSSNSATAPEVLGHDALKNFLYYVMAITAVKVQDNNCNGKFDPGDKIMFTLAPDNNNQNVEAYNWQNNYALYGTEKLAGQFFPGGLGTAIYIYDGNTVTTWMDYETSMFFGKNLTTGTATIWGGAYGNYSISGFDVTTYVPEPSTLILIAGTGLALGAGLLRRRMR